MNIKNSLKRVSTRVRMYIFVMRKITRHLLPPPTAPLEVWPRISSTKEALARAALALGVPDLLFLLFTGVLLLCKYGEALSAFFFRSFLLFESAFFSLCSGRTIKISNLLH